MQLCDVYVPTYTNIIRESKCPVKTWEKEERIIAKAPLCERGQGDEKSDSIGGYGDDGLTRVVVDGESDIGGGQVEILWSGKQHWV